MSRRGAEPQSAAAQPSGRRRATPAQGRARRHSVSGVELLDQALSPGPRRGARTQTRVRCACAVGCIDGLASLRSEEHTSELQSLMRISYAVFCLKKKKNT